MTIFIQENKMYAKRRLLTPVTKRWYLVKIYRQSRGRYISAVLGFFNKYNDDLRFRCYDFPP